MTIQLRTIPEEPKEWARWLEGQLIGVGLRDLIEEMSRFPDATEKSLDAILSPNLLQNVFESGLSILPPETILELLQSPKCLFALQEKVFTNGSDYWMSVPVDIETREAGEKVTNRLLNEIAAEFQSTRENSTKPLKPTKWTRLSIISVAAAALLLGIFLWPHGSQPSGRILGSSGLLASDVGSPREYLERLATAGNTWFDETPRNSEELQQLLSEVSSDCQILIDANHPLLAAQKLPDGTTARDWFVTKCKKWKGDFDQTLASLQSGSIDFETARSQADVTMMKLVNALRAGPSA